MAHAPGDKKGVSYTKRKAFLGHGRINYPTVLPIFDIPFEDAIILLITGIVLAIIFSLFVFFQAITGLPTALIGLIVFFAGTIRIFIELGRTKKRFLKKPYQPVLRSTREIFYPRQLQRQKPYQVRTLFPVKLKKQ